MNNLTTTKTLIERLKSITFFQRIFSWRSITVLLMDAIQELQTFSGYVEKHSQENIELKQQNLDLKKDLELKKTQYLEKEFELNTIKNAKDELLKENTTYKNNAEALAQKYENNVAALNSIKEKIEKDRNHEIAAAVNAEVNRLKKMKETWAKHQVNVKAVIKVIAQKHIVEYVDKVPFKGEPDNTLRICGEYIAFDAKSPAGEDLTNFPLYIKDQAEKAKKYAKQENVKRDIFFVVPTNTLESLEQHVFHFADHDVYVIAVDSLEQIILSLKKIESYEFAEKLSPEERDNICRVIGKFVHITKRRVQIDAYFTKHFLEMAYQAEADLPSDILEKALEFEKSEKLNPPQEKRAKAININDLLKESKKLNSEVKAKGIIVDNDKLSGKFDDIDL